MVISAGLAGCAVERPLDPWDVDVPGPASFMVYADRDGDGYGVFDDSELVDGGDPVPAGFSREASDCDDEAADVFPTQGCECSGAAMYQGTTVDKLEHALDRVDRYGTVYVCPGSYRVEEALVEHSMRIVGWNGDSETTWLLPEKRRFEIFRFKRSDDQRVDIEIADLGFTKTEHAVTFVGHGTLVVERSRFEDLRASLSIESSAEGVRVAVRDSVFSDNWLGPQVTLSNRYADMLVEVEGTDFVRGKTAILHTNGADLASLVLELRDVEISDNEEPAIVIGGSSVGTLTLEDSSLIRNAEGAVLAGHGAFADIVSINTNWGEGADDNESDLNDIDDLGANETFECRIGTEWDEPCRP